MLNKANQPGFNAYCYANALCGLYWLLENHDSVRQLREIYLPKTAELVSKLVHEEVGSDMVLEIKGILHTCAVAYESIVEKLYKSEDEDTLIDIEVLKQTFEREGLLGSDFDFE